MELRKGGSPRGPTGKYQRESPKSPLWECRKLASLGVPRGGFPRGAPPEGCHWGISRRRGQGPPEEFPRGARPGVTSEIVRKGFPPDALQESQEGIPWKPDCDFPDGMPPGIPLGTPRGESQRPPPRRIRKGRSLSRHCEFLGEVPQDSHCEFPEGVARFPFGISTGVPQEGVRKVAEGFPQGSPWEFQEGVP